MSVLKITSKNFEEEVLDSDKTTIIDFYADWCGPCKMLGSVLETIDDNDIKMIPSAIHHIQPLQHPLRAIQQQKHEEK